MRRPPPLRAGDVVRVIAPGSGFEPAHFEAGLGVLRDRLGLRPRFRDDITAREGYLAGDDRRRLAEWNEAVADPEARAIFCARGGYGAMRLLPDLDPAPLLARAQAAGRLLRRHRAPRPAQRAPAWPPCTGRW